MFVMIDYHYCSKNLFDYPKNDQKEIATLESAQEKRIFLRL